MNKIFIAVTALLLASCGRASDQLSVELKGYSERCIDGVSYLIFSTGATVKYDRQGEIVTCQ